MTARPYSPETLADRWGCSSEKVRQMVRLGELTGFRLGKLIRVPASEVDRFECQNIALCGTEGNSASPTPDPLAGLESRLGRLSGAGQRLSLVKSGATSPSQHRDG